MSEMRESVLREFGVPDLTLVGTYNVKRLADEIVRLRTENAALKALALEAADDIEAAVRHEYGWPDIHPAMQRKYDRDYAIVEQLRSADVAREHV